MPPVDAQGYGGAWWPVLRANWRDRRAGRQAAAAARLGYLRPPRGEGRVVWIKAGGSPESVHLACELLGALRERRLDIRLALTFEHDYPEIIEPRVRGLRKIGLGYGPSDRPAAVRRVMTRLKPFGLVLVDTQPHPNLLRAACAAGTHVIAFNTGPAPLAVEAAYPNDADQANAWRADDHATPLAEPADPMALFVEAQADTTLRSLAAAGHDGLHLWWWHDDSGKTHADAIAHWRQSGFVDDGILFVSGQPDAPARRQADLTIGDWDRSPLPPGRVVWVDDSRWFAAVASAATAGYLDTQVRATLWQALAGGCALALGAATRRMRPTLPFLDDAPSRPDDVWADWRTLKTETLAARRRGDLGRRYFWDERRRVQGVMDDFLQRVFDW
ncbi:glycosyltransferase N-terminal domain-containing protein [Acidihalobacter prosperus]|uniref:3-deoxy-D-manno-octulosonic acid transferase n=1 Tax=Acidihalobacter prosperus TaxID=160660 RepID=A0A1A6C8I4_9GAMM|nr:glycosyltransferase N-terminal domain-containing protein [Acidihalobacter prosperus]OBS10866.1 hypothetical protein Thpro_020582 [Acidihalobacter prosperus]